jgi:hypothetical protein
MYTIRKFVFQNDKIITDILFTSENGKQFSIPFDTANTDYAEFKKAVADGAELQDADGNVMSPEAAQAFVATLP